MLPVVLKDFEAVDVQHADHRVFTVNIGVVVFHFNNVVNSSHNPTEETFINSLNKNKTIFTSGSEYTATHLNT